MRLVIQRVSSASVKVEDRIIGSIGRGFLVLVGVTHGDDTAAADYLAKKLVNLRVFEDEAGKMNLALNDVGGSLLLVSQFTLYADCRKGNRPSFVAAAEPNAANELYEYFVRKCRESIPRVETGSFGAHMEVGLINDGPVTIVLDSI